jgi:hypothetical protein
LNARVRKAAWTKIGALDASPKYRDIPFT